MIILQFLTLIICFSIICSFPNEFESFSEIELPKGISIYFYQYLNNIFNSEKIPYIFIKLTDYEKIDLRIYLNENEVFYDLTKNVEWINIPIINESQINITFKINSNIRDSKMIFIDSSKILKLSLTKFLNLNFTINKLYKMPLPLLFNISVDKNIFFSIKKKEEQNSMVLEGENILSYCDIENNDNCEYKEALNVKLEQNKTYLFKLNCYKEKNIYKFYQDKIDYYMEEIIIKNNSFIINSFTENNYLIANIHDYSNIYFYLNDNSGFFHQNYNFSILSKEEFNNFIKNNSNIKSIKYNKITNGKITFVENITNNDYYLIIKFNKKSKNYLGFITFFTEKYEIQNENWSKEINKGTFVLIYITKYYLSTGVLSSSNKNMKLYNSKSGFTNTIILPKVEKSIIFIDSSQKSTKFSLNVFNCTKNDFYNYYFITDKDMEDISKEVKYGDNIIFRRIYNNEESSFYSFYFFDLQEKYYIYTKKYFGKSFIYKYKNPLDIFSQIKDFMKPITYYDEELFEKVNNKLLIISGSQFINLYINSGTFFDIFIQKVNDLDYIEINSYLKARILNANKLYKIKSEYELNHLVKLDNICLEAEVTFINKKGIKYILNNKHKIIKLTGFDFSVQSTKLAVIYFYKEIKYYNDKTIIKFDKSQKGKNMQINIKNNNYDEIEIYIAKDFGFNGYDPLINMVNSEKIVISRKKSRNIYIENFYDLLETDIYESEGEKYFIYIFNSLEEDNIDISHPFYFDSLTELNKYNFNIIPKGNNSLILKSYYNNDFINYQFIKCSNDDINFNYMNINDNSINKKEEILFFKKTYFSYIINSWQTLIHNFESKSEFLFLYGFSNKITNELFLLSRNKIYEIKNIEYLTKSNKTILSLGFTPVYTTFSEYHIVISKKNKYNNLASFTNPCYLTDLIRNDSCRICYKKVYHVNEPFISEEIEISKIIQNKNDDEYIINIISNNIFLHNFLDVYTPVIYNRKRNYKNGIKFKLFDIIHFRPENDYFIYEHLTEEKLIILIDIYQKESNNILLILTDDKTNLKTFYYYIGDSIEINIEKKGKYFLEFIYINKKNNEENIYLSSYSFNKVIKVIDFSENNYSGFFHNSKSYKYEINDLAYYKVTNLKEDKEVYFTYKIYLNDFINDNNIISEIESPFIICENNNDKCIKDINYYKFTKANNYTIYINLLNINNSEKLNYLWTYNFFTILENTTVNITDVGYFNIDSPKIFNIEGNKEFYFYVFNINPYFVTLEGINKGKNLPKVKNYLFVNIKSFYFYLEKNYKKKTIIFIPEENDKLKKIFITNKKYENSNEIEIKGGQNCLIELNYDLNSLDNYLETFTSPLKNMRFISLEKKYDNEYTNFLFNQLGKQNYLYITKTESDINIKRNVYEPKYIFFAILNDETIEYYKSFIDSKKIFMNSRINTDKILLNDYFNIYIDNLDKKYNLYIKQYYGTIKYYVSQYELKDIKNNIDILTKPINNLQNKKSLFNRLIQLNKNQLITGYLSTNSFLDIYIEQDNDIKDLYLSNFKNKKYLKKGIEYEIHFNLNHLIKLEPQFNAEITIYNNETKIILNNKNQTGILIGNNFKIKTNESVMVYFYPKTKKFQKKIHPSKGEIIEIKQKEKGNIFNFSIDFGFEGFEPPDMNHNYYFDELFYIENIYDKLKINLTQGEYLYVYYNSLREDDLEITYINHHNYILNSMYEYNFNLIKKNSTKKYIISNKNKKAIRLQINQCKENQSYNIKINNGYKIEEYNEEIIVLRLNGSNALKYEFESSNDIILSYSFEDSKDIYIRKNNNKWEKDRIKYNNLSINNIKVLNKNKIQINFNANYKNSLTKYIIIITPEEKNNTFKNNKNICLLIESINQKENNFIIEEYYDIGENDLIEVIIDISYLIQNYTKYIVNIISQELRFEKNLKFYEPKAFYLEKKTNKNIFYFLGIALFFILIFMYIKKSKRKTYLKKQILKRFDENFGVELNDESNFATNQS